jgi:hypothetical protein
MSQIAGKPRSEAPFRYPIATLLILHGKEGSTVRVRQRASLERKSPEIGGFVAPASTMEHLRSGPSGHDQAPRLAESPCKSICCPAPWGTSVNGRGSIFEGGRNACGKGLNKPSWELSASGASAATIWGQILGTWAATGPALRPPRAEVDSSIGRSFGRRRATRCFGRS